MKFKSVLNAASTGYCSVDGFYENGLLVYAFGQFDTYGDGETQHSHAYRIGAEKFTDFCLSMATALVSDPDCEVRDYQLGLGGVSRETFDFLCSVKYSEAKRRWYSVQLRKVTSNDDKRHDKRFQEVPTWADGSVKASLDLYWMTIEARKTLLERYSIFESWREYAGGSFVGQDECEKWRHDLTGDYHQAYRALKAAFDSKEQRYWAKRLIDSATFNSTPKETAPATADVAA